MARAIAVLLLLAFLTAGCADTEDDGGEGTGTSTQTTSAGGGVSVSGSATITGTGAPSNDTHEVAVTNDAYTPEEITIQRGDTVNWTSTGSHPHSVTSRVAGVFDSHPTCTAATPANCMQDGDSFEHEFDLEVGEYEYYCRIHSSMTGKVIVTN